MFCKKCGAQIPEGGLFCMKCGTKVSGENVQPGTVGEEPLEAGSAETGTAGAGQMETGSAEAGTAGAEQMETVSAEDGTAGKEQTEAGSVEPGTAGAEQIEDISAALEEENRQQMGDMSGTPGMEAGQGTNPSGQSNNQGYGQGQAGGQQTGYNQGQAGGQQTGYNQGQTGGQQPGNTWQAAAAAPPSQTQQKKNQTFIIVGIIGFVAVIAVLVLLIMAISKPRINLTSENTVEVEFSGGDGRGYAEYDYDEDVFEEFQDKVLGKNPSAEKSQLWYDFLLSISYKIDPDSELSNGDKVTLSAEWDAKSAKKLGISVKGKERQITVEGLEQATEVDVFESLDVAFNGYNGNGTIDMANTGTDSFSYEVYFEADKYEGLSNGDKVKITANVSDSTLEKYNYVLKDKEKEYTVEGLEEMENLDLFAGLELDYSGTSPYAELSLRKNTDEEFIDYYVFYEADKTTGIANGDVITITASVDEDYAAEYGYTISETSREYTVEGLDEYVSAYSDISEDIMDKMEEQAGDILDSWIVDQENWYEYQELKIGDPEHVGDCFLKLKDGLEYSTWSYSFENAVFMCYKAEKTYMEDDKKQKKDVYLVIRFTDFIKYSDGTIYVEITSASVDDAYDTYEDFYEAVVRSRKQDYTTEEIKD